MISTIFESWKPKMKKALVIFFAGMLTLLTGCATNGETVDQSVIFQDDGMMDSD